METVRAIRGTDSGAILADVDAGTLRWVWNVSSRRSIREYRFLLKELVQPETTKGLTLPTVIAQILGEHRTRWRGPELGQMFLLSRPAIHRLRKSKALPAVAQDGALWIHRAAVETFLRTRLAT